MTAWIGFWRRALCCALAASFGACSSDGGDTGNETRAADACGGRCPEGNVCTADGRCIPGSEGTFDDGTGTTFDDMPMSPDGGAGIFGNGSSCAGADVVFQPVTPTVILLIDRSGSMLDPFDNGVDRWNSVRSTLVDAQTGVVKQLEGTVRFGLTMYTSFDGNAGGQCPILAEVDPALNNFGPIRDLYSTTEIVNGDDDTPTSEAVRATTTKLRAFGEPGPKAIILATDGEPDTCADPDAHNADSNQLSVQAVEDAYRAGISTFVISVGDDVGADHLQDLANAGAGVSSGARAYPALNAGALVDAFRTIVRGVVSCDFELNGSVKPGFEGTGIVELDGERLVYQDANGWELPTPDTVRLLGDACEQVRTSSRELTIDFPNCGSFLIR